MYTGTISNEIFSSNENNNENNIIIINIIEYSSIMKIMASKAAVSKKNIYLKNGEDIERKSGEISC
jgi:hypothetical protein